MSILKEKRYLGKSLEEVETLAVQELGVCKDDMYFDVICDATLEETEIKEVSKEIIKGTKKNKKKA